MLSRIKKSLRISHNELDSEIQSDINACKDDLARVGVDVTNQSALLDKAIELYCKAEFDYSGKGEEFRRNYEKLRDALSLSEEYNDV